MENPSQLTTTSLVIEAFYNMKMLRKYHHNIHTNFIIHIKKIIIHVNNFII